MLSIAEVVFFVLLDGKTAKAKVQKAFTATP